MRDPGSERAYVRRLCRMVANLVYRDIDVHLPGGAVPDEALLTGPVLAVANHFGGLADAVLMVDSLPRMPRVVAADAIWRVPVLGPIATAFGGIPVHRATDRTQMSTQMTNDQMFRSCYGALARGDLVLIFPEGVTQEVPHMAEVRTGAARIVLGARATGVPGIRILPVGLHYENKAGFRSRALVNVGEPIDLDAWLTDREADGARPGLVPSDPVVGAGSRGRLASPAGTAPPGEAPTAGAPELEAPGGQGQAQEGQAREASVEDRQGGGGSPLAAAPENVLADQYRKDVRDLTALIDQQLRGVAPDHPDWRSAHALATAAEVLLNDVDSGPEELRYGDLALLSSRLGRAPEPRRTALVDAADSYRSALAGRGTADSAIRRSGPDGRRRPTWLIDVLLVLLLLPFAAAGLVAAALPLLVVTVLSRLPLAPAIRASLVPGAALLMFLVEGTLFAAGLSVDRGWQGAALGLILFPFFVAALLLVHERLVLLLRRWRSRRRPMGAQAAELVAQREHVSRSAWGLL